MDCKLCNRKAVNSEKVLCKYHLIAYNNIEKNFPKWVKAYGELSWDKYIEILCRRNETGSWIKECSSLFIIKDKK